MRHLIVGSTSFLGRALKNRLESGEAEVATLDRQPASSPHAFGYDKLPADEYAVVYLLAAHIPATGEDTFSEQLIDGNVRLADRLCTRFRSARVVYASSVSVYGKPPEEILREDATHRDLSPYGYAKLAAETVCRSHPTACVLRFSSLYGPGMRRATFLPRIVEAAIDSREITLFGTGARRQNYLHVEDAAKMLIAAGDSEMNAVFNAVALRSYSNREVAEIVGELVPGTHIVHRGEDSTPSAEYDRSRWDASFAPFDEIELAAGLRDFINVSMHGRA